MKEEKKIIEGIEKLVLQFEGNMTKEDMLCTNPDHYNNIQMMKKWLQQQKEMA